MSRKLRILVLAGGATIAFVIAIGVFVSSARQAPRYPPLPNPNGYDDFMRAAALMTDVRNSSSLDHEGLRQLVDGNAEPLRIIRIGLGHRCSIPTEEAVTNWLTNSQVILQIRSIALLLAAEARLAEKENRLANAARSELDAIRFGNEISRGGLLIHRASGDGCESIGRGPLAKLVPKLNRDQAFSILGELEKIDQSRVSWDEVLENEKMFTREVVKDAPVFGRLLAWWIGRGTRKRAAESHHSGIARLRLLMTELALRCYKADQGQPPAGLPTLVPKYLQPLPVYPFSGKPLIYRVQGSNWVLYSVGADRIDDGGKPIGSPAPDSAPPERTPRGDLFYDSPY